MATIIDCGNGRFIAGDPVEHLPAGHHWCAYCAGSGLDRGWDDELEICQSCDGLGAVECDGPGCLTCAREHRDRRSDRLYALLVLLRAPIDRAFARDDMSEALRLMARADGVREAWLAMSSRGATRAEL